MKSGDFAKPASWTFVLLAVGSALAVPSLRAAPQINGTLAPVGDAADAQARVGDGLPVDVEALSAYPELTPAETKPKIRNKIALPTIWSSIRSDEKGLLLDMSGITELLDGTKIDAAAGESIYGNAFLGPYPFEALEARFAYKRFRSKVTIRNGKATLPVGYFLGAKHNSEDWTDQGTLAVRLELYVARAGADLPLGIYDTYVAFRKADERYEKLPWIVEGPLVNLLTSDAPERIVVSFVTDYPVDAVVVLDDGTQFGGRKATTRHDIAVAGLKPGTAYTYRVRVGQLLSRPFHVRTAPPKGTGPVRFAYCGDSREGVGGGTHNYMGVNHEILHRHAALAHVGNADFFLFGGDLINGYTLSKPDFEAQLYAWKQAMSGFWHERPVFPAMGNHEALLRGFAPPRSARVTVDRWPYSTDSAEAVFADAFVNPTDGPRTSDPRRPTYKENVFTLQYGLVRVIAFNNNYWYSDQARRFGGCPEGYVMQDQLAWIERQLTAAETDPSVKYLFLYAQEPVFPCGGHVADAMWHQGNNNVRAFTFRDDHLVADGPGMIDVRNRFARAVATSSKVAAVLGSDEHAYYRVLIDKTVPVGNPNKDDANSDGRLAWDGDEPATPLTDARHAVWYITCGGGGAPYYSEERTPWTVHWQQKSDPTAGFRYSSQENVLMFAADDLGVSLKVVNPYGETIDKIENLMAVK